MAKVLLYFWLITFAAFPASAQTDTAMAILGDSASVNLPTTAQPSENKTKTWPIATAVALILLSSYLLYNVRSR